jgi:hypothetical protein
MITPIIMDVNLFKKGWYVLHELEFYVAGPFDRTLVDRILLDRNPVKWNYYFKVGPSGSISFGISTYDFISESRLDMSEFFSQSVEFITDDLVILSDPSELRNSDSLRNGKFLLMAPDLLRPGGFSFDSSKFTAFQYQDVTGTGVLYVLL